VAEFFNFKFHFYKDVPKYTEIFNSYILGRYRYKRKDNIQMDFREISCSAVDCIQDRVKERTLVNTAMEHPVKQIQDIS
jgi:hypothetical protein